MPTIKRNKRSNDSMQTRTFQCRADTFDSEARTVEAVIATDEPVSVYDYRTDRMIQEVLRMDLMTMPESGQIVLLDSHQRWSLETLIGSIRSLRVEGGELIGLLNFVEGDDDIDKIVRKVEQGHLTDISVGYRVAKYTDIRPGETEVIEGQSHTAGNTTLRIATAWEPYEGSLTAIGADAKSKLRETPEEALSVRGEDETPGSEEPTNEPASRDAGQPRSADSGKEELQMTDPVKPAEDQAARQLEIDNASKAAVVAERGRVSSIRELATGQGATVRSEAVEKAIADGISADEFRGIALEDERAQRAIVPPVGSDAPNIILAGNKREERCTAEVLAASVAMRLSNAGKIEQNFARCEFTEGSKGDGSGTLRFQRQARKAPEGMDNMLEEADRYRSLPMVEVLRESLRISKIEAPLQYEEIAERAFSTPALSSIFSNALGAELLAGFDGVEDTTMGFCRESDDPTFRKLERHKVVGGNLTKHKRGGEADHAELSDSVEYISNSRFSKQFQIDEMNMADIQSSLNVLQNAADTFGPGSARLRPDLVWALILSNPHLSDGVAAFDAAGHSNDFPGVAMDQAGLSAATAALHKQKDIGGNNLSLPARYLIAGSDNADRAFQLARSLEVRGTASEFGTISPASRHNLMPLGEARLSSGVTDPENGIAVPASPDSWFVITNGGAYTIEVVYGMGGRMPVIRTTPLTNGKWGFNMDCKFDLGAAFLDHRGLVRNNG